MSENKGPTTKQIFWGTTITTLLSTWPFILGLPIPYFAVLAMAAIEAVDWILDVAGGGSMGPLYLDQTLLMLVPLILSIFTAYIFSRFILFTHTSSIENGGVNRLSRLWRYFWLLVLYILIHYGISFSLMIILDKLALVKLLQA